MFDNCYTIYMWFSRLLENELQRVQKIADQKEKELQREMQELKHDNERQQKLIGQVCVLQTSLIFLLCEPDLFLIIFMWI